MTSNKLYAASFALIAVLAGGAQPADLCLFEAAEPHMGTIVHIKLYAADQPQAEAGFRAAFDRVRQLDGLLSDYKPDSELNMICRTAVGRPVRISSDLFRVLAASQSLAEESQGAFDVTLGPITRLWRAARASRHPPDLAVMREALRFCGYRKLHLDEARRTVMLDQPGMQLDAGGIAKGYAADAALAALEQLGIHSALVAVSGDLAFGEAPPGQHGWRIGIPSVEASQAGFSSVLELSHAAVSTSGDAEQHLDSGGARYSHIIAPASGMGLTRDITVTVVAPQGILADGLSTAVSVLGADRGMPLVEKRQGVAALIVTRDGGMPRLIASSLFRRLAKPPSDKPAR